MVNEDATIDFDKMTVWVRGGVSSFKIRRSGSNGWCFFPRNGNREARDLTKDTSAVIEKAYRNWTMEKIILGA